MAWCCQASSHYQRQCWARSMSPYGITRPQCIGCKYLPLAHLGRRVLSCPALSVHPSVHPALVTTLQPTIFHGSCSYLAQPLTLVWALTLLIMRFLCLFSRIQLHFEILWIHWLASWSRPAEDSSLLYLIFVHFHITVNRCYFLKSMDDFSVNYLGRRSLHSAKLCGRNQRRNQKSWLCTCRRQTQ